jgi:hypothetical protein
LVVAFVVACALSLVLAWLIMHISSAIYIFYSGVSNPAELSEDYGFGMLISFVSVASAIVGFSFILPFSWNFISSCWVFFRR